MYIYVYDDARRNLYKRCLLRYVLCGFARATVAINESMSDIFGNKPDRNHDVQDDGPPGWRLEAFTLWLRGPGVLADRDGRG